jgi:DNA-binding transcriptional MocR family regulator
MDDVFPHTVSWTRPTGGYTIWVKLPRKWDEEQLHSHLGRYGVVVSPGSYYFPFKKSCEYFRLSIAKRNEPEIMEAITRLGKALHSI